MEEWTDKELEQVIYCYDTDIEPSQELQVKIEKLHQSQHFKDFHKSLEKYTDEELDEKLKQLEELHDNRRLLF